MKLYIVGPNNGGEGVYNLLSQEGEHLASHFCSSKFYALGDLESYRPERQKEWKERFGEYEVLWLGEDDMTLERIHALNDSLGGIKKEKLPSVTITIEEHGKERVITKVLE